MPQLAARANVAQRALRCADGQCRDDTADEFSGVDGAVADGTSEAFPQRGRVPVAVTGPGALRGSNSESNATKTL